MAGKAGVLDEVSKVSMLNKLSEVNPYITDNDSYGYGYAIDNNGNEITDV